MICEILYFLWIIDCKDVSFLYAYGLQILDFIDRAKIINNIIKGS